MADNDLTAERAFQELLAIIRVPAGDTDRADVLIDAVQAGLEQALTAPMVPDGWVQSISNAAEHLTNWMDMDLCECEGAHTCGYQGVKKTRDQLRAMLTAATAPTEPYCKDCHSVGMIHCSDPVNCKPADELATLRERVAELESYFHKMIGVPASVGVCEPIEGYVERPGDAVDAMREMAARLRAEVDRIETCPGPGKCNDQGCPSHYAAPSPAEPETAEFRTITDISKMAGDYPGCVDWTGLPDKAPADESCPECGQTGSHREGCPDTYLAGHKPVDALLSKRPEQVTKVGTMEVTHDADGRVSKVNCPMPLFTTMEGEEINRLRERVKVLESFNLGLAMESHKLWTKYEQLRAIIDDGSESMTHDDAVAEISELVKLREGGSNE